MDEQNKNERTEVNQSQETSDPIQTTPPATAGQTPQKGYGKRPWWQWLLIYLVVGAIVYGIIYAIIAYTGDGSGTNNSDGSFQY